MLVSVGLRSLLRSAGSLGIFERVGKASGSSLPSAGDGNVLLLSVVRSGAGAGGGGNTDVSADTGSALSLSKIEGVSESVGLAGLSGGVFFSMPALGASMDGSDASLEFDSVWKSGGSWKESAMEVEGRGGGPSDKESSGELGRRRSNGFCSSCCLSSLLGRLRVGSKGPLLRVFMRVMTFSPALLMGPLGSMSGKSGGLESSREVARDDERSLPVGVLRPLLVDGRLPPLLSENGKGGNAQSRFAESSGLGGRGSHRRGIGLVILRIGGGGLPPKLLPERELVAGDIGVSERGAGAKNGILATSALIRGGAGRGAFEFGT